MAVLRTTVLICLLLAGCTSSGQQVGMKANPVDCVFNGPCTNGTPNPPQH